MGDYKHKKKFGQNFLKNKKVLIDIIDSIDVKEDDLVIEIGPGEGDLTKYLKLYNCNLLCYEIDTDLKKYLDKFEDEKTRIIYKDFLESNVNEDISRIRYNNLYIIANLPYYITTPILEKIINDEIEVKEMTLMVQKEVAQRFSASPGNKNYGSISVYLQSYYDIQLLFEVGRNNFDPIPNVDSAVIKFTKNNKYELINNKEIFNKLVKDSFFMKRKNLRNNLHNYDLKIIEEVLKKYDLTMQDRAEQLSLDVFIEIANKIS